MELTDVVSNIGIDLPSLLQGVEKISGLLPKAKALIPKIGEWEKTLNLKPNQKVSYSLVSGSEEIFVYVWVIEQKTYELKDGSTINITEIVDQKYNFKGFEEVEKLLSFLPAQ